MTEAAAAVEAGRRGAAPNEIFIHVIYPLAAGGRIALRCDLDWGHDIGPFEVSADRTRCSFRFLAAGPFHYFKPVLHTGGRMSWSQGNNYLALGYDNPGASEREIYPYFLSDPVSSACTLRHLGEGEHQHDFRVFYPPGYAENPLKRYPVLYMQDGQNAFAPHQGAAGTAVRSWKIDETLALLDQLNVIDKLIVVAVYPRDRLRDYTAPGYVDYGRFLVGRLKPYVDANYRTLAGPEHTALLGSSLGGVVSFYLAWQYPEVFGMAACMSSTFGYRDDLRARVATEDKRAVRFYLDSGWPHDNYEVTRDLRTLMLRRGYDEGDDLIYLAFPEAMHNERFWSMRVHIPIQLFFGRPRQSLRPSPLLPSPPVPHGPPRPAGLY